MSKKVIVAMSGGVDSSVAALLLKEQGFEVEGVFMKNWSPETIQSLTDCPWEQDMLDAEEVCQKIGIPFRSLNFEKEYKQKVVDYFVREYAAGRTPNPDVMCNKEIKFAAFLDVALSLGADYMATGHYARVQHEDSPRLLRGLDAHKDQSYFLYTLNKEKLSRSLFPVGNLPKSEVRRLATEAGLSTATKKDSQGICFIGHIDLKKFLQEVIDPRPGFSYLLPEAVDGVSYAERISHAKVVGSHSGSHYYTIGERAGSVTDNGLYRRLRPGDVPALYILSKDQEYNTLFITTDREDRDMYVKEVVLEDWLFTGSDQKDFEKTDDLTAQIRYQQQEKTAVHSIKKEGGQVRVKLVSPLWAVALGQSLVVYKEDQVIGGGIVQNIIR